MKKHKKNKDQDGPKKVRISVYMLKDSAKALEKEGSEFGLSTAKWMAIIASYADKEAIKERIRRGEIVIAL